MGFSFKSITRSKTFEKCCKSSFEEVDVDSNGNLDYKELYIALLLFYDKMNAILPVHLEVPTKGEVHQYLIKFDADESGRLEFKEFLALSKELFGEGKSFKDSIFFKAGTAILLNMLIWPLAGFGAQKGLLKAGVGQASKVPVVFWSFAAQGVVKFVGGTMM